MDGNKMKGILWLCLLCLSLNAFSAKFVITGKPVDLELQRGNYIFPEGYSKNFNDSSYHYVRIIGIDRVCFLKEQPALATLDLIKIYITDKQNLRWFWFCYRFDPYFFEIDY